MTDAQNVESMRYDRAKKVPAMLRGFCIQTSYGDIEIDAEEAKHFADLAYLVLTHRIVAAKARD